jgi:hypothetical protein
MKKIIIYLFFLSLLTACQSAREGFTLKKKDNSDEFLVEKKNPLVMPPDYGSLPVPDDFQNQTNNSDEDDFEKIIGSSKSINTKNKIKKTSIEQSVFEKIN